MGRKIAKGNPGFLAVLYELEPNPKPAVILPSG
jgi:hypothetical protein